MFEAIGKVVRSVALQNQIYPRCTVERECQQGHQQLEASSWCSGVCAFEPMDAFGLRREGSPCWLLSRLLCLQWHSQIKVMMPKDKGISRPSLAISPVF